MASISPFNQVLGKRLAKHLLQRGTFHFTKSQIDQFATMNSNTAVDQLFNSFTDVLSKPQDTQDTNNNGYFTDLVNFNPANKGRKRDYVRAWWWYNALHNPGIQHKLSMFLYNQFTTSISDANPSEYFDYLQLIRFYATGNIKTLAIKMTLDNTMLDYLDNHSNIKNKPNENYAREFLELFTIGKGPQIAPGNYTHFTEQDIVEAAKVLTGFRRDTSRTTLDTDTNIATGVFDFGRHDTTIKTFSAAFGNVSIAPATDAPSMATEFQSFVDMIFNQSATATYICTKLYRYFVSEKVTTEIETDIIAPMANSLRQNNYNISYPVKLLLKSQHFYDADDSDNSDEIIGAMIKSPHQLLCNLVNFLDVSMPDPITDAASYFKAFFKAFIQEVYFIEGGMSFFSPSSVAGYPAYYQAPDYSKYWFTSTSIISRYKLIESIISGRNKITIRNNALNWSFDVVDYIRNSGHFTLITDATVLVTEFIDHLFPEMPDTDRMNYFINDIFLGGAMAYNWSQSWNDYLNTNDDSVVRPRLEQLLTMLVNSPEFQTF